MPRPRTITDEQILTATRSAVLEYGPAVSLDVVADQLGVTPPALFKRFGSRRALLIAALRPPPQLLWQKIFDGAPDGRPFVDQLKSLIEQLSDLMTETVPCMMALRESGIPNSAIEPPGQTPGPVRGVRLLTRWLERRAEAGLCDGHALETAATALLGSVMNRSVSSHLMKRLWSSRSQREYINELASLFARAVAPETRSSPSSVKRAHS